VRAALYMTAGNTALRVAPSCNTSSSQFRCHPDSRRNYSTTFRIADSVRFHNPWCLPAIPNGRNFFGGKIRAGLSLEIELRLVWELA